MNDYYKVAFEWENGYDSDESDVLAALLGDMADFESFDSCEDSLCGYVKKELFSVEGINQALSAYPFSGGIKWAETLIPGEDWNTEWEKNYFKPIVIADRCVIHSSFHTDYPQVEYDIEVNPKMAFGTGHHETTALMITQILSTDMNGLKVLDMGTGTGVLAMLCARMGSCSVKGVEIDPMAYENAVENVKLNGVDDRIKLVLGDASSISHDDECYDYLLANINRNIILADIERYAHALRSGGRMQLSGFYDVDCNMIAEAAKPLGLELIKTETLKNWAMMLLRKA